MKKIFPFLLTAGSVLVLAWFKGYFDLLLLSILVVMGVGVLIGFVSLVLYLWEQYNILKARRLKEQRDAEVFHIISGDQVFIREMNHKATWRNASIDPRIYANGKLTEPLDFEVQSWSAKNVKPLSASKNYQTSQLISPLPQKTDLFDLLPQKTGTLRNLILGVRIDELGQVKTVSAPILRLCHVAIGGATDSGKSNLGRAIAFQTATSPEFVKLAFSDLKGTTFKCFKGIDKLLFPIMETEDSFMVGMSRIKEEMDYRKGLFKHYQTVETLPDYNKEAKEELPYILIFIDEVSNLFMNEDTQKIALEVLREARAFGIYLIAMGQSWSHKEMSTSIRQQFRTAFHFGTNDPASSRMLLNDSGATQLMTQGRALVSLPFGMSKGVVEVQTPFISNNDVIDNLCLNETKEAQIRRLSQLDLSRPEIAKRVYGSVGGSQYSLIEKALQPI